MKAMIFAAGLGTRLRPLTDTMPKALVSIGGMTLLERVAERLIAAGFDELIINVHHFADQITDFVRRHNDFGVHVAFSDERELLLDTGGGIRRAAWFFDDGKSFLVHNVDILSNADLRALYDHHVAGGSQATLLASHRPSSRQLLFDESLHLRGWCNTHTGELKPADLPTAAADRLQPLAFAGIHVISPSLLSLMDGWGEQFSIIDFYLSAMRTERIIAFRDDNLKLVDVGKPESLKEVLNF